MAKRRVLLVDDSRSARYALKILLQKHECEVDVVDSAKAAIQRINETTPDVVFMDHLMPEMTGFEALDVIKSDPKTAQVPVVMCTSNDELPYQIEAREKGALGILSKPGTPEKLAAVLIEVDAVIAKNAGGKPAVPASLSGIVGSGSSAGGTTAGMQEMLDGLRAELEHSFASKIEEQLVKLRAELHSRENALAQALIQKIAKDVLPQMGAQIEQKIMQRLGK